MTIAKCEKCGKEYQLKSDEKPSDFKCECGGELSANESFETLEEIKPEKTRRTWNERTKRNKAMGIIGLLSLGVIIILVISGISGMFYNNPKSADGNPIFQNQYVSFEYPTGYYEQAITNSDASNSIMDIGIYKSGNLVGEIDTEIKSIKSIKNVFKKGDVLYGKLRPNLNKVWLANIDGICSTDILVLTSKSEYSSELYELILRSDDFNREVLNGLKGAQLPRVSFDYMSKIQIPTVSEEIQKSFIDQIKIENEVISSNFL